jgi:hypothetical protein
MRITPFRLVDTFLVFTKSLGIPIAISGTEKNPPAEAEGTMLLI